MRKKKAVIITGATKRLGLRFTRETLELGYAVVAHYRGSKTPLHSWLQKNPEFKSEVHFIQQDLTDSPERLIKLSFESPFEITGLINNAATFTHGDLLDKDHFETTMRINALIPLDLSRRFAQQADRGWIINITDAHISSYNQRYQNYRIAKKLLVELTEQLATLLAPRIRVNAVAPGAMLPPSDKNGLPMSRLKKLIPLKKTGDLTSLMQAYRYLLDNTYITGQTLYVDGGWHLIG